MPGPAPHAGRDELLLVLLVILCLAPFRLFCSVSGAPVVALSRARHLGRERKRKGNSRRSATISRPHPAAQTPTASASRTPSGAWAPLGIEFRSRTGRETQVIHVAWPSQATENLAGDVLISSKRESLPAFKTRWRVSRSHVTATARTGRAGSGLYRRKGAERKRTTDYLPGTGTSPACRPTGGSWR